VLFYVLAANHSHANTYRIRTGASATPIYDGSVLADENDVVVVSINYRLNIFGFSGAPGQPPNAGLWDQRLALEWVRDNAEAFGGDPSRLHPSGNLPVEHLWISSPTVSHPTPSHTA